MSGYDYSEFKSNIMAKAQIKSASLAEMKGKYIGKTGTAPRKNYEEKLGGKYFYISGRC